MNAVLSAVCEKTCQARKDADETSSGVSRDIPGRRSELEGLKAAGESAFTAPRGGRVITNSDEKERDAIFN